jgi:predicted ATPase
MARQHLFEAVHQFLKALITPAALPPVAAKAAPAARQMTAENRLAPSGEQERLVIFLDDLHWIDSDTVDLLRYLAYRLHDHPIWLVGAYQSEGMAAEHPFLKLRRSLITEDHAHVLRLARLPVGAIVDWVAGLPGLIVRRAEGNPFITSQILRELRESTSVEQGGSNWRLQPGWPAQAARIPFAVREIVLLKLGRLNPGCLELFSTAAVIGESFDLTALQQMSNGVEDIQICVFDWLEQGLVTMVQPGVYKFSHGMYREVAAEWLSPWHRLRAANRPMRNEQASAGNVVRLPAARPTGT